MENSDLEIKERRKIMKTAAGLALGVIGISSLAKKSNASVFGEENVALAAIVANTASTLKSINEYSKTFDAFAKTANGYLNKIEKGWELADKIRNYDEIIKKQKQKIKGLSESFYAFKGDPLSSRIPLIRLESQPLIKETSKILKGLATITAQSITPKKKSRISTQTRHKAGNTIGKIAAGDIRDKINKLKNIAGNDFISNEKSAAKEFGEQSKPIEIDQNQLILETLVRQEVILSDIYRALSGQGNDEKSLEDAKSFSNEDFNKTLKTYMEGKGTIIPK